MNLTPELIMPRHIPPARICARAREYLTAWTWGELRASRIQPHRRLVIRITPHWRLLSRDSGQRWHLMTHETYNTARRKK